MGVIWRGQSSRESFLSNCTLRRIRLCKGSMVAQAASARVGGVAVREPRNGREGKADCRGDAPVLTADHEPRRL